MIPDAKTGRDAFTGVVKGRVIPVYARVDNANNDTLAARFRDTSAAIPDAVCAKPGRTRVGFKTLYFITAYGFHTTHRSQHVGFVSVETHSKTVHGNTVTV